MTRIKNKERLSLIARTYAGAKGKPFTSQELRNFMYDSKIKINGDVPNNFVISQILMHSHAFDVKKVNDKNYYSLK